MASVSTAEDHFRKSAERPVAPAARLLRRCSSAPGVQLRWDPRLFNLSVLHHFQLALTANTHKVCRPSCPILHKQLTKMFACTCSRTPSMSCPSSPVGCCTASDKTLTAAVTFPRKLKGHEVGTGHENNKEERRPAPHPPESSAAPDPWTPRHEPGDQRRPGLTSKHKICPRSPAKSVHNNVSHCTVSVAPDTRASCLNR